MKTEDEYIEEEFNRYLERVTECALPLWICDLYMGNHPISEQEPKESESAEWNEPGYMAILEKDSERISGE